MGYRKVTIEQLSVIWTQKKAGASNRAISIALNFDRKTINQYVKLILEQRIPVSTPYSEVQKLLANILVINKKTAPVIDKLKLYGTEIRALIVGDKSLNQQAMKAKTAWLVLKERHKISDISYESFKRFIRDENFCKSIATPTIRIESAPGDEIQIDYAKMGLWAVEGNNRIIHAFIGLLASSRFPFVRFCLSQDQESFAESNVLMLEFYGGSPRRINLDNLKSGVVKVNIYDPTINRTFAELCDHYSILVDPSRPASPKDKGKVERIVQIVREVWKRLTALHPTATLDELNILVQQWIVQEYGQHKHGTTEIEPFSSFEKVEKAYLKPLPKDRYVASSWTIAKVHPDQFITVKKKLYGVPAEYIGKTVQARIQSGFIEIFYDLKLIRSYTIPNKGRAYLKTDFPEYGEPFAIGSYASSLIMKAGNYGILSAQLINLILESGGQLSIRRAQGCLCVIQKNIKNPFFNNALKIAIEEKTFIPDRLKKLFEKQSVQLELPLPVSDLGLSMARDANYYANP